MFGPAKLGQTGVVTSLNPEWNARFDVEIYARRGQLSPLRFELFDKDTLTGDDALGLVELDITPCLEAPGTWAIDGDYKLQSRSSPEYTTAPHYLTLT
jgi:Ca2+-dependent lipid-binding protein